MYNLNLLLAIDKNLFQKIESNNFSIYLLICVIRYVILTIIIKKKKISHYNYDFIQYFGEFPEFCTYSSIIKIN